MGYELLNYIKGETNAVAFSEGVELSDEQLTRASIELENEMQEVFDFRVLEILESYKTE